METDLLKSLFYLDPLRQYPSKSLIPTPPPWGGGGKEIKRMDRCCSSYLENWNKGLRNSSCPYPQHNPLQYWGSCTGTAALFFPRFSGFVIFALQDAMGGPCILQLLKYCTRWLLKCPRGHFAVLFPLGLILFTNAFKVFVTASAILLHAV